MQDHVQPAIAQPFGRRIAGSKVALPGAVRRPRSPPCARAALSRISSITRSIPTEIRTREPLCRQQLDQSVVAAAAEGALSAEAIATH